MGQIKKPVLIFVVIGMLIVMGFIGLRIFQYFHVMGFQTTMKVLVDTGTNGKYELYFGDTDINYSDFLFTIDSLVIRKKDLSDSSGVIQIKIPNLIVDLGPISSIFISSQFEIDRLSFNEPVAFIGLSKDPEESTTPRFKPINIPHQIAQFYPAVKTILDHFNVKHFQIDRAGLNLETSSEIIQVRLLDLLITDWDMRNLGDDAKFHLALGNQSLDLQHSEFSFSSVVWDYHRKELDLLDYQYIQKDTSHSEVIHIEGAALKIFNLDYQVLITDEEYDFERLLIVDPVVTAHIYPKRNQLESSVHPLSDILKRHFGTLSIQSGAIRNAMLDLTIYRDQDTVALHLPRINLVAENFRVTEDSATLMIDKLALDVHETELDIGSEWKLKYKNLYYDENYNVRFDSLRVKHSEFLQPVLLTEQLALFNFNVFTFIYENTLRVDSIHLKDASMYLDGGLFANDNRSVQSKTPATSPVLEIGRLRLDNVEVGATIGQRSTKVNGLTGVIDDFLLDDGVDYSFRFLRSPAVWIQDQQTELRLSEIMFESSRLLVGSMIGTHRGMDITAENLQAVPGRPFLEKPPVDSWELISISNLSLTGNLLPHQREPDDRKSVDSTASPFHIQQLRIGNISVDVGLSDSSNFAAKMDHIRLDSGRWDRGIAAYHKLQANITNLKYRLGSADYRVGATVIHSDSLSQFTQINMEKSGEYNLAVNDIVLGPFTATPASLEVSSLLINDIVYTNVPTGLVSTVDSVRLVNLHRSDSALPFTEEILVYAPDINMGDKGNGRKNRADQNRATVSPLSLFSKLKVSPGQFTSNGTAISFDNIALEPGNNRLKIDLKNLAFKAPTSSVHIGNIYSDESNLYIDSMFVVPINEYVMGIETETDILSAQIKRIHFQNVNWDSLIQQDKFIADQMIMDDFDLSIKRDKTLPDPEQITKPYLLTELIPSPETVSIPKISGRGGRVVYFEIGEETGQEGHIAIDSISFTLNRFHSIDQSEHVAHGSGLIYNRGQISYDYHRLDSGKFSLSVQLTDLPMELLNQMVDPLQAAKIRSGHLHSFEFNMIGDSLQSSGEAVITYDDLHVEIFKSHQPDVRNFGSSLLTLLVDKIVLKHSKYQASADFVQDRITFKGPINYWVKSGIHAAAVSVIKGKQDKKAKKASRRQTP